MKKTDYKFVNIYLTDFQKMAYAEDIPHEGDMIYLAEELVSQSFKITLGTNQQNSGFFVSITDKQRDGVNAGSSMTAWGSTIERAFGVAYWALRTAESKGLTWELFKAELDKDAEAKAKEFKEKFFKDLRSQKS